MAAAGKHGFNETQVAEFKEQFAEVDEDGSGLISSAELKTLMERCGIDVTPAQVGSMIKENAKAGASELDFEDFLGLMWRMQSGPSEKDIRNEMFTVSGGRHHHDHDDARRMSAAPPRHDAMPPRRRGLPCALPLPLLLQLLDDNMDGLVTIDELKAYYRKAAAESGGALTVPADDVLKQVRLASGMPVLVGGGGGAATRHPPPIELLRLYLALARRAPRRSLC